MINEVVRQALGSVRTALRATPRFGPICTASRVAIGFFSRFGARSANFIDSWANRTQRKMRASAKIWPRMYCMHSKIAVI